MKVWNATNHVILILNATPFAQGGEGCLYKVLQPQEYVHLVAKIYHSNKRTKQRQHKLRYLIENPPIFDNNTQGQLISWPVAILEMQQRFVGFLMPKVEGELLEILVTPKLPRHLPTKWQRFELGTEGALALRQKVCFNIAVALYHIHQTGKYVMVDLKPDNILIQSNGLVALVDMDSIEVIRGEQILFPAAMATPEFAPPEFHALQGSSKALPISWDAFSMAVVFYKILLGIHPFAATTKGQFKDANGLGEKLKHGLYVHNPNQQTYFSAIPSLHRAFDHFPIALQYLFNLCFIQGVKNERMRPSAEDWCLVFGNEQGQDEELMTPLGDDVLKLYAPILKIENIDWLTNSFECLFHPLIQAALPTLLDKFKKERYNWWKSIKRFWKLRSNKDFLKVDKDLEFLTNLFTETAIPDQWKVLLFQKIQKVFDVYQCEQQRYKAFNESYKKEFTSHQEAWKACQILYQEQYHQLSKAYRKKCVEIRQNQNTQPLWKAFIGKTASRKQRFLENKYLPTQQQDLEEGYLQQIATIDACYQPRWEALENTHYEILNRIDNLIKPTRKVEEKAKEEIRFIRERQVIIDAIKNQKNVAKNTYEHQKKILHTSVKHYIEQLYEIENSANNQIKVLRQSIRLRLSKMEDDLLAKKERYNKTLLNLEMSFVKNCSRSIDLIKKEAKKQDIL